MKEFPLIEEISPFPQLIKLKKLQALLHYWQRRRRGADVLCLNFSLFPRDFDLTALQPPSRQQLLTLPPPCSYRDLTYWEPVRLKTYPHREKRQRQTGAGAQHSTYKHTHTHRHTHITLQMHLLMPDSLRCSAVQGDLYSELDGKQLLRHNESVYKKPCQNLH